jgi:hypothetical protein
LCEEPLEGGSFDVVGVGDAGGDSVVVFSVAFLLFGFVCVALLLAVVAIVGVVVFAFNYLK